MDYKFLDSFSEQDDLSLPKSGKINRFLLKNNISEVKKAISFLGSEDVFLYIHGFLGTGKRQFINYVSDFVNKDVVILEYYCKASTVCDDIMLSFIQTIENNSLAKAVNINTKITTLFVKFEQYISSIKKPFLIILHSYDDILEENRPYVLNFLKTISKNSNVKIISSTRAMSPDIFGDMSIDKKIFLKAFSKEIFKEFIDSFEVACTETVLEDFYKYTRGYYYYTALSLKIVQAMKISLADFLNKFAMSEMSFDSYLGLTYINMIPSTIRKFFWFLRTIRHGMTLNALAVFELYDEFSVDYLKNNLMIFQKDDTIYVQDYFLQNIDISIPAKTEIKLHKYIMGIYEKFLKEPLQVREIMISRQALRAEIEYHKKKIMEIETGASTESSPQKPQEKDAGVETVKPAVSTLDDKFKKVRQYLEEKKNTEAIELYNEILNSPDIGKQETIEANLGLARIYKSINNLNQAKYYYELAEVLYKKDNEVINLNYLYYELTDVYYLMYKHERAVETIKKVIYSVDTPQSLMVSSCTLLGNIYSDNGNAEEAYSYYQKALDSIDENAAEDIVAELYFKLALANDDRNNEKQAFEYYSKCITFSTDNPYKVLAYSNLGSLYFDNENYSDAKDCFLKAYEIEKKNNNFEGIYYNASFLAKIGARENSSDTLNYLIEAKQCAEFLNENFYILESTLALGDYYYNNVSLNKKALAEYFKARKIGTMLGDNSNLAKIETRIKDMKLRMDKDVFEEIESKYAKN